ncbi:MAG: hypothetical protein MK116_06220 [Phycisphaerales bacterium]|nr:hypothetical protein [Phycisphaerales bacterium]
MLSLVLVAAVVVQDLDRTWTVPDLSIGPVPEGRLEPFRESFQKYSNVFGVHVFATERVPDDKLRHVASVMAEYLDNDEDGTPDNPLVAAALADRDAYMVMSYDERGIDRIDPEVWHREGFHAGQFQFALETAPGNGEFDATLEEVLHLITAHGWANAYPATWGERRGTEVADCLDRARGGHFVEVPRQYPDDAWFSYDDETCEYQCMVTEYVYWALTSLLGAQQSDERCAEIHEEWRACTPKAIKAQDPWIVELLQRPKYRFPTRLPDGIYAPADGGRAVRGGQNGAIVRSDLGERGPIMLDGLQLFPRRPNLSRMDMIKEAAGSLLVSVAFDSSGKPVEASIVRTCGVPEIDRSILASMYTWRASGDRLASLQADERVSVQLEIMLKAK